MLSCVHCPNGWTKCTRLQLVFVTTTWPMFHWFQMHGVILLALAIPIKFVEETHHLCRCIMQVANFMNYIFQATFTLENKYLKNGSIIFRTFLDAYAPLNANSCMDFYQLGIVPNSSQCLKLTDSNGSPINCCLNSLDGSSVSIFRIKMMR